MHYGDAYEVRQGKAEADGDGGESLGRAAVGRAHDDDQEERSQDDFGDEAGEERVAAGGVGAVSVGGEAGVEVEAGGSAGDDEEHSCRRDRAYDLRDDVRA